ncbi:DnaG primase-like protein, probable fragment [Erwinia pyrifoliae Ep1/96]|nr:DnaG primase-like protein, probable fragment [Erwinia pyrifoliae Ep1/96]
MPRIPQKELDELKRSVSLAALAESQGHRLRQQGRDRVLLCPFHQEKTP